MIDCVSPVVLKSGLVVGCGKCLLCRQKFRDDWSVRLQMTAGLYNKMPLMVTLTYRNEDLHYSDQGFGTLFREDVQLFMKRLKDRLNLYNNRNFAYFGCGEYGGRFGRPHYHIIFFGFDELQNIYDRDVHMAENWISDIWQHGHADVCQADWSGVHYVTKYCLKDSDTNFEGDVYPSFTFCSRGLGREWLNTREGIRMKICVMNAAFKLERAMEEIPEWVFGFDSSSLRTLRESLASMEHMVPKLQVELPSGSKAPLPRYFRKKLIGSFEHFKDNPFWRFDSLNKLCTKLEHDLKYRKYNLTHNIPIEEQRVTFAINKILQRLREQKNKKSHERI